MEREVAFSKLTNFDNRRDRPESGRHWRVFRRPLLVADAPEADVDSPPFTGRSREAPAAAAIGPRAKRDDRPVADGPHWLSSGSLADVAEPSTRWFETRHYLVVSSVFERGCEPLSTLS